MVEHVRRATACRNQALIITQKNDALTDGVLCFDDALEVLMLIVWPIVSVRLRVKEGVRMRESSKETLARGQTRLTQNQAKHKVPVDPFRRHSQASFRVFFCISFGPSSTTTSEGGGGLISAVISG